MHLYLAALLACCVLGQQAPVAKRIPFERSMFGDVVVDNYAWIANRSDPDVYAYLQAENAYANTVLADISPLQDSIAAEMIARVPDAPDEDARVVIGEYYYWKEYTGEFGSWYRAPVNGDDDEDGELILDEDAIASKLNTTYFVLGAVAVSPDGKFLAYTYDTSGGESFTLRFHDMDEDVTSPELINGVYYEIAWSDETTIYYNTLDPVALQPLAVYRHTVGQEQEKDELVWNTADLVYTALVKSTSSGQYIVVYQQGQVTNAVFYIDVTDSTHELKRLGPLVENQQTFLEHTGDDNFYLRTNVGGALNFKISSVPVDNTTVEWEDVVPPSSDVYIYDFTASEEHLVLWELVDTKARVRVVSLETEQLVIVPLPGDWAALTSASADSVLKYSPFREGSMEIVYSTMIDPERTYLYEFETNTLTLQSVILIDGYDPSLYEMTRLFVPSEGDVTVPVTLAWRKESNMTGQPSTPRPMYLTSYGAYADVDEPFFDAEMISLMDRNVIYARAHVRGSAVRGWAWYDDGRLLNKQNTFSDFVATAEYLIQEGWTSASQLAAHGRSAGGLLAAAVLTQRPDLFAVVWAQVPFCDVVTDQLNRHLPWAVWEYVEWGNPHNVTFYWYMKSYDPYENINATAYPRVYFQGGWNDPIVSYTEPTKFIARLRHSKTNGALAILDTIDGGHMGDAGDAYVRNQARQYAFVLDSITTWRSATEPPRKSEVLLPILGAIAGALIVIAVTVGIVSCWRRRKQRYTRLKDESGIRLTEQDGRPPPA